MSIRTLLVAAAVLSALAFAAGCGDDDDSATGSSGDSPEVTTEVTVETGSLSKPAFIKQVNAICDKTWKQFEKELLKAFEEEQLNPPKPTALPRRVVFFENGFPEIFQNEIDEISAVGAPQGDEQEITAFLEALQKMVNESIEEPEEFGEELVARGATFGKAAQLSSEYGLDRCLEEREEEN